MKKVKCSLFYHNATKKVFLDTCTQVYNGIYNNTTVFVTPPYTEEDFNLAFTDYTNAAAAYKIAPSVQKTNYLDSKNKMTAVLDTTAIYVDDLASGDESLIYLAGFTPTKATASKSVPIAVPNTGTVKRGPVTGQITVENAPIKKNGIINYIAVVAIGAPLPNAVLENDGLNFGALSNAVIVNFNRSRKKVITNLPPGSLAYVYFIATNPVSVSPLGQPVTVTI